MDRVTVTIHHCDKNSGSGDGIIVFGRTMDFPKILEIDGCVKFVLIASMR